MIKHVCYQWVPTGAIWVETGIDKNVRHPRYLSSIYILSHKSEHVPTQFGLMGARSVVMGFFLVALSHLKHDSKTHLIFKYERAGTETHWTPAIPIRRSNACILFENK
jgi:hypothetical protein